MKKQKGNLAWEAHRAAGEGWVELEPNQGQATKMQAFRASAGSVLVCVQTTLTTFCEL